MRRIAATLVIAALAGTALRATVIIPADLGELSRDARAIARGTVVAIEPRWTEDRRAIETLVTLQADGYLKGALGDVVRFRVPGGELGRYRSILVGAPAFAVGQRVIVFLGARSPSLPHVLGLSQGVYRLSLARDGTWVVTPSAMLSHAGAPATLVRGLAAFEREVRALAGATQ